MLLFIFLCKLYDSLTTSSWSWPLICTVCWSKWICLLRDKNGKTSLHFQSVAMCGRATALIHHFLSFDLFSIGWTIFGIILWSVCLWKGLRVEAKKLSSVWTRFLDGLDIFWKKSPLRASQRHARVSMSHVHQSLARAWNALIGTISGEKPQFWTFHQSIQNWMKQYYSGFGRRRVTISLLFWIQIL